MVYAVLNNNSKIQEKISNPGLLILSWYPVSKSCFSYTNLTKDLFKKLNNIFDYAYFFRLNNTVKSKVLIGKLSSGKK